MLLRIRVHRHLKIDDTLVEPPLHIRKEGVPVMQRYLRRIMVAKTQLSLDLSGMLLHDVRLDYYKLVSLTSCDLSSNQLTAVPEEVFRYTDLSWLDLRNNLLMELPSGLQALGGLRHLDARGNQIQHVPASIFARSALLTLSLANNDICGLGGAAPEHVQGSLIGRKGVTQLSLAEAEESVEQDLKAQLYHAAGYGERGRGTGAADGRRLRMFF